jgi:hypothetical protein
LKATYFFGAMQIDGFIDKDEFKKQIDAWIRVFAHYQACSRAPTARSSPATRSEELKRSEAKKESRY